MKKFLVVCFSVVLTTGMFAAISGSAHDFSASGWNASGEICITCHTPHNADTTVSDAPIWNHEITSETFTPYGTTMAGTVVGAPNSMSLLCLSCHDGVTALDSFGGTAGGTTIGGTYNVGTDLTDDHPVSVTYVEANGLYPTTNSSGITGGTTIAADMLFSGNVECSSCHDVHNKYSIAGLLKKSNAASALCLTCHNK